MRDKLLYTVDGQVLTIHAEGSYSADEFLKAIEKAFNAPELPKKAAVVIDALGATVQRTEKEYTLIAESLLAHADRILCLAYVTSSDHLFEVVQKASTLAAYNRLGSAKPFRDMASAQSWVKQHLSEK